MTMIQVAVTGASRGIGRAIAIEFAKRGARIFLVARDFRKLTDTARDVEKHGGSAVTVACDITNERNVDAIPAAIENAGGRLDVLVNNAGIFRVKPFLETDVQREWRDVLDANLTGTFLVTLRTLPFLLNSQKPHLFNILSVAALQGFPGNAAYCASKWGARGLAESLRAEWGDRVNITNVYPGATDTDIWEGAPFPHDRSKMIRAETIASRVVHCYFDSFESEIEIPTPPGAVGS